ncbi:MAG: hypothetical protein KKF56_04140 [Nanoarchaeota archaeon]|nr:hypothetical protein [Nanoarchaeota archaeon]
MVEVWDNFVESIYSINLNEVLLNVIIAVALIVVGVILGKVVMVLLRRLSERLRLEKIIKYNFIEFVLVVVKWAIYVIFINMAFIQLDIPSITNGITAVLSVFPTLVAALLLIVVGFGIATYLRDLIIETGIENETILAGIIYYFTIYIFVFFGLKSVLGGQDRNFVDMLILIVTALIGIGLVQGHLKGRRG